MLSEAIDERPEARGFVEHAAPELVGEVGGDDDGALFVPATHDVEKQICGSTVAGDVTEVRVHGQRKPLESRGGVS